MPRYQVVHQATGETWEIEVPLADDARDVVGWPKGVCRVLLMIDGPFVDLQPPKIAEQITPPTQGVTPVCPECNMTMMEKSSSEFWWYCPACNLRYQEWENQFYNCDDEIV